MEHRWNIRHSAKLKVLLHHEDISEVHCKTRNIGRDGMFVETEHMTYQPHTMVRVEFESNKGGATQRHNVPALVVHSSAEGLGLMFMQPNTYDLICDSKIFVESFSAKPKPDEPLKRKETQRLTG